ncbi:MAG: nitrous oxide reductase family maturation protein NosD, partial [Gemmatimonadaceae bacterium]|nr:nitrous oxide reductase family maturation protein NosD [Gemmatimonadaceae bacterium]
AGAPIAHALARAAAGDTIVLAAGTYREPTLVVTRPVTLLGRPGATLDGAGRSALIVVRADDVTVQGLALRNTGASDIEDRAALRIENAARCRILDNRIDQAFFGIYLARVTGCEVRGNVVRGPGRTQLEAGNGIHLWHARDVVIAGNRVEGQRDGLYFEFTRHADVHDNASHANSRYGLHFMFSDSCAYVRNRFERNAAGVAVMYSHVVTMTDNRFADAWGSAAYGLLLKSISDSRIERNVVRGNSVGLHLEDANRNHLAGNRLERNGWALRLMSNADDNTVEHNDFVANAFDVLASGERSGTAFRENYWDAYRGYDLNRNGLGDVPHHPVRLFALVVEQNPPALALLRSVLLDLLDLAERVLPVLTPAAVADAHPALRPQATALHAAIR